MRGSRVWRAQKKPWARGGFDEDEIKQALELGILPVSLGKRILRTETAGLAILSVLMMKLEGALS